MNKRTWHVRDHPETDEVAVFHGDTPHGTFPTLQEAVQYAARSNIKERQQQAREEYRRQYLQRQRERRANIRHIIQTVLMLLALILFIISLFT